SEKEGAPKCSRRAPNQATSCQLCPTACRPVCLPERQHVTSMLAKRFLISETMVMAAIGSIEAYLKLTTSQSLGGHRRWRSSALDRLWASLPSSTVARDRPRSSQLRTAN